MQLCKKLVNAQKKFNVKVKDHLDKFRDNSYTSLYVPIIIRLQKIYREMRLKKQQTLALQVVNPFMRQPFRRVSSSSSSSCCDSSQHHTKVEPSKRTHLHNDFPTENAVDLQVVELKNFDLIRSTDLRDAIKKIQEDREMF